jgi:hypothetical protein
MRIDFHQILLKQKRTKKLQRYGVCEQFFSLMQIIIIFVKCSGTKISGTFYKVARSTRMPHIRVHGYVESTGPCPKVGLYFLGLVLPMAP